MGMPVVLVIITLAAAWMISIIFGAVELTITEKSIKEEMKPSTGNILILTVPFALGLTFWLFFSVNCRPEIHRIETLKVTNVELPDNKQTQLVTIDGMLVGLANVAGFTVAKDVPVYRIIYKQTYAGILWTGASNNIIDRYTTRNDFDQPKQ